MRLSPPRRLLWAAGLKPYLRRCPLGLHDWRPVYGDEVNRVGARWTCRRCPRTHPNPVLLHPDRHPAGAVR